MDLMQRITSTNGIDIQDSAHVRVPAGEIRAALAEVDVMRRERDELAARLAEIERAEPVAWVPMHPRFGALWAMTTATPSEERLPSHYPLSPLYASSAPAAAPERAADLGENIIEAQRAQVRTLAARLAQIAAQPPERPLYPFNAPLGERSLRRVHCRLNPELLDGLDHFEDERWKRIAENAQAVTTGGDDKGDYFEVPAHLMAALALALDDLAGARESITSRRAPQGTISRKRNDQHRQL